MPWDWKYVDHKIWTENGWEDPIKEWDHNFGNFYKDNRSTKIYKYEYKWKWGDIQIVDAEIYKEKRECRWKYITFLPFPKKIIESLVVVFSGEIGEQAGSWKGGCCRYNISYA